MYQTFLKSVLVIFDSQFVYEVLYCFSAIDDAECSQEIQIKLNQNTIKIVKIEVRNFTKRGARKLSCCWPF